MDVMKEFQIRSKDGSKATSDAMGELSKGTQKVWKDFLKGKGTVADVASTVVSELKGMDNQVTANQIGVGLFGRREVVPKKNHSKSVKAKFKMVA